MQQPSMSAAGQFVQPQFVMVPMAQTQRNGLGAFAFFLALVGLFVPTGIVALLALMLGLAAVGRAPRGLATGAVIIGLLGCAIWLVVMLGLAAAGFVAAIAAAVFAAAAFAVLQPEAIEITSDMVNTVAAVEAYEREHGVPAADLEALSLGVATSTDPWGGAYRLVRLEDEREVDLVSSGPDGIFDTGDDVRLSGLGQMWEAALDSFDERLEELGQRLEHLNRPGSIAFGGTCSGFAGRCSTVERRLDRVTGYRWAAEQQLEAREAATSGN
jgi:hypothetical protein